MLDIIHYPLFLLSVFIFAVTQDRILPMFWDKVWLTAAKPVFCPHWV